MTKIFFILFFLILSGCENKKSFNKNFSFTPEVIDAISLICKGNGDIKFLELTKNDYGYFQCQKQGYLKIYSHSKIENILNKNEKTFIISKEKISECQKNCNHSKIEFILNKDEPKCLCR